MLPNLPKKRKHKEADITPQVMRWFEKHYPRTVTVEVKVGKNKPKPHQAAAIAQVLRGLFSWKIPDMGRRNPFDFIILKNADACIVACEDKRCTAKCGDKTFTFTI